MNTYALDVRLAQDHITIGPVQLLPRGSTVSALTHALGQPDRILPMHHNNTPINTLYIYDQIGIRFWAKDEIVSELQLVLETKESETFPVRAFVGPIEYRGQTLFPPVPSSFFTSGGLPGFVQDTDRLQYGTIVYEAKTPHLMYTVPISNLTGNTQYISIR